MHILLVMSLTGKFFEAKVPQLNVSVLEKCGIASYYNCFFCI